MMRMSMRRLAGVTVFWDSCLGMLMALVILMSITLMRMRRNILLRWLTSLGHP
ncbi:hypothetical protein CsSME_00009978 [Camellia sinensis var. sinensis]